MSVTFNLVDTLTIERVSTFTMAPAENFVDTTDEDVGTMNQTVSYGSVVINQNTLTLIPYDEE